MSLVPDGKNVYQWSDRFIRDQQRHCLTFMSLTNYDMLTTFQTFSAKRTVPVNALIFLHLLNFSWILDCLKTATGDNPYNLCSSEINTKETVCGVRNQNLTGLLISCHIQVIHEFLIRSNFCTNRSGVVVSISS